MNALHKKQDKTNHLADVSSEWTPFLTMAFQSSEVEFVVFLLRSELRVVNMWTPLDWAT
jgi:hypothetical protein